MMRFQSAPGGEAGGKPGIPADPTLEFGFNPPPAVRPGGKAVSLTSNLPRPMFQSAPGGEAGGILRPESYGALSLFQSAPGGEAGGKVYKPDV